jgi:hypothetical protein
MGEQKEGTRQRYKAQESTRVKVRHKEDSRVKIRLTKFQIFRLAICVVHVCCPLFVVRCSMSPYGLWSISCGLWSVVNRQSLVVNVQWSSFPLLSSYAPPI